VSEEFGSSVEIESVKWRRLRGLKRLGRENFDAADSIAGVIEDEGRAYAAGRTNKKECVFSGGGGG
jgi:hypothetical protein